MKRLWIIGWFALALGLSSTSAALAHHSFAMFDRSRTVTLSGSVTEFEYTNPHSWLHITVVGANGQSEEWGFEAEGPSTLLRAGIKAKTFQPGDMVTVTAYPMRDGRNAGSMISVTKADGTVYRPRPSGPASGAS
jgi:hypothetical protein